MYRCIAQRCNLRQSWNTIMTMTMMNSSCYYSSSSTTKKPQSDMDTMIELDNKKLTNNNKKKESVDMDEIKSIIDRIQNGIHNNHDQTSIKTDDLEKAIKYSTIQQFTDTVFDKVYHQTNNNNEQQEILQLKDTMIKRLTQIDNIELSFKYIFKSNQNNNQNNNNSNNQNNNFEYLSFISTILKCLELNQSLIQNNQNNNNNNKKLIKDIIDQVWRMIKISGGHPNTELYNKVLEIYAEMMDKQLVNETLEEMELTATRPNIDTYMSTFMLLEPETSKKLMASIKNQSSYKSGPNSYQLFKDSFNSFNNNKD
ncbi:hypothetical protein DFA_00245 [Cavenderia fasciculata]|uniref:Uncharacterized protein n=1 Tax=Cavenderia fasciculata TaxID=261658 RepID=F4PY07_CACFS|nr:uncharacterized protein DFA_00245 [Cavenderia fasciculata]EGG19667.1 hypothetical protein DFA_00245 [Cavenderia fasciculata]|eukprot:XP_004357961.1 hypothetical protein DFA_00245 [Cavenderia fasciculata]